MSAPAFEEVLARLYVDPDLRAQFLDDPNGVSRAAGLSQAESDALVAIDRVGLQLAAESFACKRRATKRRPSYLRKLGYALGLFSG